MRTLLRRTCAALALTGGLAAADPGGELAWAPPVDRGSGPLPAEHRPLLGAYHGWFASAAAIAGPERRLTGLLERHREEDPLDGMVVLGLTDGVARQGERSGHHTNADAWRRMVYLRGGTDPLAVEGGQGLGALGFASVTSWGGGPSGIWIEGGWSEEREMLLRAEAMAFLAHVVGERDEDQLTFRCGLALRWPGQPIARTPQSSPWSFSGSVDWIFTDTIGDDENGFAVEATLGWRVFGRVQLLLHGEGVGATIAEHRPTGSGSIGIGIGF